MSAGDACPIQPCAGATRSAVASEFNARTPPDRCVNGRQPSSIAESMPRTQLLPYDAARAIQIQAVGNEQRLVLEGRGQQGVQ